MWMFYKFLTKKRAKMKKIIEGNSNYAKLVFIKVEKIAMNSDSNFIDYIV